MLPAYFPESRILGFGFDLGAKDAPIDFEGAAAKVLKILCDDRGGEDPNPIVFIGHGYGAVVIETLFSRVSDTDPFQSKLVSSTASIILFAPPIDSSNGLIEWTEKSLKPENKSRFMGIKGTTKLSDIWKGFNSSLKSLDTMANISVYVYKEKGTSGTSSSIQGSYCPRTVIMISSLPFTENHAVHRL